MSPPNLRGRGRGVIEGYPNLLKRGPQLSPPNLRGRGRGVYRGVPQPV